jgi:hypothetical protein
LTFIAIEEKRRVRDELDRPAPGGYRGGHVDDARGHVPRGAARRSTNRSS